MTVRPEQEIPHRWVDTEDSLTDLVDELVAADEFALDTEFHRERTYYPRLALIQVAWKREDGASRGQDAEIALIDPVAVDPRPLGKALEKVRQVIMHAPQQDYEVLERACGVVPSRVFDTQVAAGFLGLSSPSLSTLVERFLGSRLAKGDRLTDWFQRPLGDAQRRYAASDVVHLAALMDLIAGDLSRRGRVEWAFDESERMRTRATRVMDPEEAWMKIKEARHLRGRALVVAQELAAWRERTAQRTDQPVRFVLSDLALVGVAQKAPTRPEQLKSIRGLDGRHLRDGAGREILEAVRRGLDRPPDSVQRVKEDGGATLERRLRPAVTLVSAWISQLARDEDLDPALLATRADIVSFLRGDEDSRLNTGWRNDLVGTRIRSLVEGRSALSFDDGRLVLESRERS